MVASDWAFEGEGAGVVVCLPDVIVDFFREHWTFENRAGHSHGRLSCSKAGWSPLRPYLWSFRREARTSMLLSSTLTDTANYRYGVKGYLRQEEIMRKAGDEYKLAM